MEDREDDNERPLLPLVGMGPAYLGMAMLTKKQLRSLARQSAWDWLVSIVLAITLVGVPIGAMMFFLG